MVVMLNGTPIPRGMLSGSRSPGCRRSRGSLPSRGFARAPSQSSSEIHAAVDVPAIILIDPKALL